MSMLGPTVARRYHAVASHAVFSDSNRAEASPSIEGSGSPSFHRNLELLFSKVARLASLPLMADRILRLPLDQQFSGRALVEVIKSDPAMTASIMRRVNSSYFGMTRKVSDLSRAANLLGAYELRNLALTVLVKRMFDRPAHYGRYDREALWRHCLAVAVSARKIARVTGAVPQHEAYVSGLMHHVGTLLIDLHMRSRFCQLIELLEDGSSTYLQERRLLSFDQSQLGEYIVRLWNFPAKVAEAIRYHEYPHEYLGEHEKLVYVVSLADYLCSRAGMTALGVFNTKPPADIAYATLGIDRVALAIIWDDLLNHLAQATSF
ncbi:MAG: HDOD domain-containing protein [Planctomycetaceae bacterium]|nr:HDOD domain-containing protein [Planctomycetales bacterium]MCB9925240.1 HDOD domain-containing protein [Planctomycetaceae bacterium]